MKLFKQVVASAPIEAMEAEHAELAKAVLSRYDYLNAEHAKLKELSAELDDYLKLINSLKAGIKPIPFTEDDIPF